jgi:hypothetical protein
MARLWILRYEVGVGQGTGTGPGAPRLGTAAREGQPPYLCYGKEGSQVRLSVPIHGNKPLKVGLLKHLLKQAGLTEDDLDG